MYMPGKPTIIRSKGPKNIHRILNGTDILRQPPNVLHHLLSNEAEITKIPTIDAIEAMTVMTAEEQVHQITENQAEEAIREAVPETEGEERQERNGKVRQQDESLLLKDFQTIQFMPLDLNSQEMMTEILVFGTETSRVK